MQVFTLLSSHINTFLQGLDRKPCYLSGALTIIFVPVRFRTLPTAQGPFGIHSGSVRVRSGPFGVRSGSVRDPFGVRLRSVRASKPAAANKAARVPHLTRFPHCRAEVLTCIAGLPICINRPPRRGMKCNGNDSHLDAFGGCRWHLEQIKHSTNLTARNSPGPAIFPFWPQQSISWKSATYTMSS